MRRTLLVSTATAAILGGFVFATAQEMPRGGKQEGTIQNQGSQGAVQRGESQPRQLQNEGEQGQRDQGKAKQAQPKPDPNRKQQQTTGQGPSDQGKAKQAQPKPDPNRSQQQTTGQGPSDQGKAKQAQPKLDQGAVSDQSVGQSGQQQDRQVRQDSGDRTSAQGRVELSVEQRTRIRQTVFARSDVPRVSNVNFNIAVGTVVPARVRVAAVPAAIVDIRPEFRNHLYFVVRDEIVILDNRRRIVAVIPVDTAGRGGAVRSSAHFVDLSPDEIREVQLVLIQRGFSVETDGVFGPRTRQALIQFQQRQGLQATGRIDSRTIAELGVSIRSGQQPATTGQGGASQGRASQGGAGQPSPDNQGSREPQRNPMGQQGKGSGAAQQGGQTQSPSPTTGQGGGANQGSPANQGAGAGQGGASNPAAKAKQAPPSGGAPGSDRSTSGGQ